MTCRRRCWPSTAPTRRPRGRPAGRWSTGCPATCSPSGGCSGCRCWPPWSPGRVPWSASGPGPRWTAPPWPPWRSPRPGASPRARWSASSSSWCPWCWSRRSASSWPGGSGHRWWSGCWSARRCWSRCCLLPAGDSQPRSDQGGSMTDPASTGNDTWRFDDLRALYVNCTLKRSPEPSHTQGLIDKSRAIMERHGVAVDELRAVDHDIATGVWPDMTEHGWASDAWPAIYQRVLAAEILVLCGPIWLGDNGSVTKLVIERLYACSSLLNAAGQYAYYGRVAGCLITGNEDGIKHCAMNLLYSLQHLGYTIPPQADAGWIGEAGPGPSYLDPGSGGPENDFTNRNATFATWNLMHLAALLKRSGGIPAYGNQRSEWDAGCRFDADNPEHR